MVRPINVDIALRYDGISYSEQLKKINMYVDDLIDWKVPFIEEKDSWYPISKFGELLAESYRHQNLDKIIKKVRSYIL